MAFHFGNNGLKIFVEENKGEKALLRKLKKEDAAGMLEWMHDPEVQKGLRMNAAEKTEEDAVKFIERAVTEPIEGGSVHFAIVDEYDQYEGTISLKNFSLQARNAEYAICLRSSAQHKGVAAQATKEILKLAFEKYKLERVYLSVLSDNIKALQMYEKVGFIYEGELRRHLFINGEYKNLKCYSMLKEEYQRLLEQK